MNSPVPKKLRFDMYKMSTISTLLSTGYTARVKHGTEGGEDEAMIAPARYFMTLDFERS